MADESYQAFFAVDESMDLQPIAFTLKILSTGEQRRFQDDFIAKKKLAFVPRSGNDRLTGVLNRLAVAGTIGKRGYIRFDRVVGDKTTKGKAIEIRDFRVSTGEQPSLFTISFASTDIDPKPDVLREVEPGKWLGPPEELAKFRDVREVFGRLDDISIYLDDYDITITAVYSRAYSGRPYGFDFKCGQTALLLKDVTAMSVRRLAMRSDDFRSTGQEPIFNPDNKGDTEGFIAGGVTAGQGFRQIGPGSRLHIEIDAANDTCNAHVDSHGYVTAVGKYDWGNLAFLHGYWDLASHYLPGAFGSLGERGRVGPMARPIRGPLGDTVWIFGFIGEW
jgi:hypothetical protein